MKPSSNIINIFNKFGEKDFSAESGIIFDFRDIEKLKDLLDKELDKLDSEEKQEADKYLQKNPFIPKLEPKGSSFFTI